MKILTILGARPQFIKATCLNRAFKNYPQIQEVILHTGQHYDFNMNNIFFEELQLTSPHYQLECGGKNQLQMIAALLEGIQKVVTETKPDTMLVYGDTNSTLAAALTSSKLHIPLIHIEAGLRSFNPKMSEETNRILTDRISTLLFCPTTQAMQNLEHEGFSNFSCKFYQSGDVMKDNAMFYAPYAKKPAIPLKSEFVLATIHRAENTDDYKRLKNIFDALEIIASDIQVILPLHPRTSQVLRAQNIIPNNIACTYPLSYLETLWLLQNAKAVFTDSGGVQKEAYFFNKPCFILRDQSEWEELIQSKCALLVGTDKEKIINSFGNISHLFAQTFPADLYGNGKAGDFIAKKILEEKCYLLESLA